MSKHTLAYAAVLAGALLAHTGWPATPTAANAGEPQLDAYKRWEETPHGKMLRRILPPGPTPATLPEPDSAGAKAMGRYCVQCHYLPSPAMHTAEKWPGIVERMDWRMQGKGNMGTLMKDMMAGVQAPGPEELNALLAYLKKHAQKPIRRDRYPDLASPAGRAFDVACSQCHALPDPERHTAKEWPKVVDRMKKHLQWVGTVRGREPNPEGELQEDKIVMFLQRHARTE
jgi:hypothetical protein